MANLIFINDPMDPYIHQITKGINTMNIDEPQVPDEDPYQITKDIDISQVPDEDFTYSVLSIDIGIHHLGISVGLVNEEYNLVEIAWVDMLDITKYTHERELKDTKCSLRHTKSIADWLEHIFHEHKPIFEDVNYILVERQPVPYGLVAIEQLIYYRWRDKCHLVHPRSMHKYFKIGHYDYEQRKEMTIKIAISRIDWHPRATERYEKFERQHDISDSICLMIFWLKKKEISYFDEKRKERLNSIILSTKGMTTDEWFNQFKYIPRPRFS